MLQNSFRWWTPAKHRRWRGNIEELSHSSSSAACISILFPPVFNILFCSCQYFYYYFFFSILFIVHFYSTTVKKCPFAIIFHTFIVHILYKWCVICYLDSLCPSSTNLSLMPQEWAIRFREFLKPLCSSSNNFVALRVHCSKGKVGTTAERWAFPNA